MRERREAQEGGYIYTYKHIYIIYLYIYNIYIIMTDIYVYI